MRALGPALATLLLAACVPQARPLSPPPIVTPPPIVAPPPASTARTPLPQFAGTPTQGALLRGQVARGVTLLIVDGRTALIPPDGRFVVGFDRDAPASVRAMQLTLNGPEFFDIAVAPRAWPIERVDAPYRAGKSDAEFDAARPAELAAINAARATKIDAEGWRQPLRWPAIGRLSGRFGAQRVYQGKPGSFHSGDDVAVPAGTPVSAPADGVVILAADHPFTLEGNILMIAHGMGLTSALLHLSRIDVTVGQHVRQGERIALSGATGRATGPHLHWGLQWRGAKLDPLLVAGPLPPR